MTMLWPKAIQASYSAVEQKSVDDLQEYNLDEFQHAVVTQAAVRWKMAFLCSLTFNTILFAYSIWSSAAFWKPEHPSQLSHSSVLECILIFPFNPLLVRRSNVFSSSLRSSNVRAGCTLSFAAIERDRCGMGLYCQP